MELKYRGVSYQPSTIILFTPKTDLIATYRGQSGSIPLLQ